MRRLFGRIFVFGIYFYVRVRSDIRLVKNQRNSPISTCYCAKINRIIGPNIQIWYVSERIFGFG